VRLYEQADALVVPRRRCNPAPTGQYSNIVRRGHAAELRRITVQRTDGERAIVAKVLPRGERVVTRGQLLPRPRVRVRSARLRPSLREFPARSGSAAGHDGPRHGGHPDLRHRRVRLLPVSNAAQRRFPTIQVQRRGCRVRAPRTMASAGRHSRLRSSSPPIPGNRRDELGEQPGTTRITLQFAPAATSTPPPRT